MGYLKLKTKQFASKRQASSRSPTSALRSNASPNPGATPVTENVLPMLPQIPTGGHSKATGSFAGGQHMNMDNMLAQQMHKQEYAAQAKIGDLNVSAISNRPMPAQLNPLMQQKAAPRDRSHFLESMSFEESEAAEPKHSHDQDTANFLEPVLI